MSASGNSADVSPNRSSDASPSFEAQEFKIEVQWINNGGVILGFLRLEISNTPFKKRYYCLMFIPAVLCFAWRPLNLLIQLLLINKVRIRQSMFLSARNRKKYIFNQGGGLSGPQAPLYIP